jgi:hypothetical protein
LTIALHDGALAMKPQQQEISMIRQLDEPAFPIIGGISDHQFNGMSLRDYFAAKAMAALITAETASNTMEADLWAPDLAYSIADAMLAERAK